MKNQSPRKGLKIERVIALILVAVILIALPFIVSFHQSNEGEPVSESPSGTQAERSFISSAGLSDFNIESPSTKTGITISKTEEPESIGDTAPELESLGEFSLTAYCPCVKCCGEWSAEHPSRIGTDYIQKTASGTIPEEGRTIGVDPDIIPFGTIVIINGHEYIAEDRGGAVKGNSIDIFFESHEEALNFGRQSAEVFVKHAEKF